MALRLIFLGVEILQKKEKDIIQQKSVEQLFWLGLFFLSLVTNIIEIIH